MAEIKEIKMVAVGRAAVPRRVLSETRSDRLCLVERSDFIRAESAEWGRVVRQANIKIDQNGVWPSAPRVAICQRVCTPFKYVMPRRGIDDQKQPLAPEKPTVVTEVNEEGEDDDDDEGDDELIDDEADWTEERLQKRFDRITFVVATRKLEQLSHWVKVTEVFASAHARFPCASSHIN
jgi:hypothetical protein